MVLRREVNLSLLGAAHPTKRGKQRWNLSRNVPLIATTVLLLRELDNATLAISNNAINGFGKCPSGCAAYRPLLELDLITTDGCPRDRESLQDALAYEVCRRLDAGIWN